MIKELQCLMVVVSLGVAGCAQYKNLPPPEPAAVQALEKSLTGLDSSVSQDEARRLAASAYESSRELAREYRAVRPAWWHNVLVNVGLKKRGLCYEWATDLTLRFRELHLFTLELHWAVARADTLREHNGVVVCARGQPFEQGVILDAWRYSGRLHWAQVSLDEYPWRPGRDLPESEVPPVSAATGSGAR